MILAIAFAIALYSACVLDLDIVGCLFALQETRFEPRKIAKPPFDLLSSSHPAQLALEKQLTSIDGDLMIHNLIWMVPLTYLKILSTTVKCTVVGACKNW
jgi:hypothetical protein